MDNILFNRYAIAGSVSALLVCIVIDFKISLRFRNIETRLTVIETNLNVPTYKDIPNIPNIPNIHNTKIPKYGDFTGFHA